MTVSKKQLLNSLKLAMPGIESGNVVLQGSDTFIFHNGRIFSYNDSIAVSIPIEQSGLVEENIEGAIKADEFFKVLSKLPNDEITLELDDNVIIKSGKAKVEMTLMNFDFESRLDGIATNENWIDLSDDFIAGLKCCRIANNKSPLSGIFVDGNMILSTDGFQMNKFNIDCDLGEFWMSDNSANELLKMKFKSIQVGENWVHFLSDDGVIFSIRTLMKGKFPKDKVMSVLDNSNPSEGDLHSTFPSEFFSSVDRAVPFSIDISEHSTVRIKLSKGNIEVSSERASGKFVEDVPWDDNCGEFEDIVFYADSNMILSIANKAVEFYLLKGVPRNGRYIPRLLFTTEKSVHLMTTFDGE